MKYFAAHSLFSEKITELRTTDGNLIGLVEELGKDSFKATNYLKLQSSSYTFEDAKNFILSSFNKKSACQTRIPRTQIQFNF